jgi:hypothetical protein
MRKRWLPFWLIIIALFYGVCFAVPDIGIPRTIIAPPPQDSNITFERIIPFIHDPKVKQEKLVIEYILDLIGDYIFKHDWENYDATKRDRSKDIADIIEKYEYTKDEYGVYVTSYRHRETRERHYWKVEVIIEFKIDEDFFIQENWTIELEAARKGK